MHYSKLKLERKINIDFYAHINMRLNDVSIYQFLLLLCLMKKSMKVVKSQIIGIMRLYILQPGWLHKNGICKYFLIRIKFMHIFNWMQICGGTSHFMLNSSCFLCIFKHNSCCPNFKKLTPLTNKNGHDRMLFFALFFHERECKLDMC